MWSDDFNTSLLSFSQDEFSCQEASGWEAMGFFRLVLFIALFSLHYVRICYVRLQGLIYLHKGFKIWVLKQNTDLEFCEEIL